jgi:hypothetical protein
MVISSGYPRSIVPNLRNLAVDSAKAEVVRKHLRYTIAYVPSSNVPAGYVLGQSPAPGTKTLQGRTVTIKVSSEPKWVTIFSDSGSDSYQSPPFRVHKTWRIKYRCDAADSSFGVVSIEFSWTSFGNSFTCNTSGELHTYYPSSPAGTYQMSVTPYSSGSTWYFQIDDLR